MTPPASDEIAELLEGGDIYFLRTRDPLSDMPTSWRHVTRKEFVNAEGRAGFHSKFGPGNVATGGFSSSNGIDGRVVNSRYFDPKYHQDDAEFVALVASLTGSSEAGA